MQKHIVHPTRLSMKIQFQVKDNKLKQFQALS